MSAFGNAPGNTPKIVVDGQKYQNFRYFKSGDEDLSVAAASVSSTLDLDAMGNTIPPTFETTLKSVHEIDAEMKAEQAERDRIEALKMKGTVKELTKDPNAKDRIQRLLFDKMTVYKGYIYWNINGKWGKSKFKSSDLYKDKYKKAENVYSGAGKRGGNALKSYLDEGKVKDAYNEAVIQSNTSVGITKEF
jgi:hypothetical protein